MSYQSPSVSGAPVDNTCCGWSETGTVTGATLTVSHALAASQNHYLCGIAFSAWSTAGENPDELTAEIKDGTDTIWKVSFQSSAIDDNTPSDSCHLFSLPHPIRITAGAKVDIVITGATGYITTAYANIWGFTV